ncbi:cysteinyl leukotriene receptor 2 [Bombina bombina]|uniref:cysteinyl leukotriene receptor 2 n=1 Tax=Bombina bombina TaxID=8345 RepID=UPI00235A6A09|nr:cysteinyl leukotriene receptor 2 [Bombina bombina]XP_053566021.1 cysteinyl leukotriene receptor 2 [Bombina bombina]
MEAPFLEKQKYSENESLQCQPEEEYKYHVYTAIYIIVFVFGVLFNGAAIYVFCIANKKKGISSICLMNLAYADLIFIIFLPLRISYYVSGASWIFGDILCRITTFTFYFSMYSSIYFLACLTMFRYLSVVFSGKIYVKKVVWLCAFIWVFTAISTTPFLTSGSYVRENKTRCFEPSGVSSWKIIMHMNYYALSVGFILPFLSVVIFNSLLIKHILQIPMSRRNIRKQVTMIVLVLLVYTLCFLPYHIQRTIHLHYLVHHPNICSLHDILQRTVVATLCLAVLNSCLDPLFYIFVGHGFKSWFQIMCGSKNMLQKEPSMSNSDEVDKVTMDEIQMNDEILINNNV